jgi:hypothetical protein
MDYSRDSPPGSLISIDHWYGSISATPFWQFQQLAQSKRIETLRGLRTYSLFHKYLQLFNSFGNIQSIALMM